MLISDFIDRVRELPDDVVISLDGGTDVEGVAFNLNCSLIAFVGRYYEDDFGTYYKEPFTVGNLKEIYAELQKMGKNPFVVTEIPKFLQNQYNVYRWSVYRADEKKIYLNDKRSEDIKSELDARFEMYLDSSFSDADALQDLFEAGFTMNDIKGYKEGTYLWAVECKDKNALQELYESVV